MPRGPVRFLSSLLTLACLASAAVAQTAPVPSFVNDVEPIFTRFGCNQGACHGKGAGQNGFRLSLRAFAPEWDHDWLTREFGSRRVNRAVPEASLVLRKPTGQAEHGGGVRLRTDSFEYALLRNWIANGAKADDPARSRVKKLTVSPSEQIAKKGETLSTLVRPR